MDYLKKAPPAEAPSDGYSIDLNTEKYEPTYD